MSTYLYGVCISCLAVATGLYDRGGQLIYVSTGIARAGSGTRSMEVSR